MSEDIRIIIDPSQIGLVQMMLEHVPRQVPRVLAGAINKTLMSLRSHATKRIAAASGLKQKTVRDGSFVRKASRGTLEGGIRFSGRRIKLIELGARQTRKGVTYRLAGGGRGLVAGAFIAAMPGGHTGVFTRQIKGLSRGRIRAQEVRTEGRVPRLHLWEVVGATIREIWEQGGGMQQEVRAEGNRLLAHYVDQDLNWALERFGHA